MAFLSFNLEKQHNLNQWFLFLLLQQFKYWIDCRVGFCLIIFCPSNYRFIGTVFKCWINNCWRECLALASHFEKQCSIPLEAPVLVVELIHRYSAQRKRLTLVSPIYPLKFSWMTWFCHVCETCQSYFRLSDLSQRSRASSTTSQQIPQLFCFFRVGVLCPNSHRFVSSSLPNSMPPSFIKIT